MRSQPRRTRDRGAQVLHRAPEPILELSSSLWLRHGEPGCARQAPAALSAGGLRDSLREAEEFGKRPAILKAEPKLGTVGPGRTEDQRNRVRPQDGRRQAAALAARQDRIATASQELIAPQGKGCGNAGSVESVEKQKRLSHSFHRPLEISPTPRDSHIPTARLRGPGKVENQTQVFHFPTPARDDDSPSPIPKLKKGSRRLRGLRLFPFHDHLVLETLPGFRIILGFENAQPLHYL